jgi:branched-chain amino acid transport system permease protein
MHPLFTKPSTYQRMSLIMLLIIALYLPFCLEPYHTFQLTLIFLNCIALIGMNLLVGYNGQLSVGHSAFYALGAYTTAILMHRYHLPYALTIPIACVLSLIMGLFISIPARKLDGIYLAIATFGLALSTAPVLKYFDNVTGGSQGIVIEKLAVPSVIPLTQDQWVYGIVLFATLMMVTIAYYLVHSQAGRAIIAIRDNPIAASVMGINISYYKTLTFAISAMYAGLAGNLAIITIHFVAPDLFTLSFAISFLIGIMVGGRASISGCFYGAIFLLLMPQFSESVLKTAPDIIYGIMLIIIIFAIPEGIVSLLSLISPCQWLKKLIK